MEILRQVTCQRSALGKTFKKARGKAPTEEDAKEDVRLVGIWPQGQPHMTLEHDLPHITEQPYQSAIVCKLTFPEGHSMERVLL